MDEDKSVDKIAIPGYLRISKIIAYALYVWVIIGIISLVTRVFLLLFSANPDTPFVKFIYNVSAEYLNPFRGIFPPRLVGETGYLDVAALFAVIVYLFVMWGFSAFVEYVQNKIEITTYEQEKEIKRLKQEQENAEIIQTVTTTLNKPTKTVTKKY